MNLADHLLMEDREPDANIWMETVDSERVLEWVSEQNARTWANFDTLEFRQQRDSLAAIYSHNEQRPYVDRYGDHVYCVQKKEEKKRGVWQRSTWDHYLEGKDVWETLIDLDDLAVSEGEDWVWQTASIGCSVPDRAMVGLSKSGADEAVYREFDLETREFVKDGFFLPSARNCTMWVDRDTLFVLSTLGEGHRTVANYYRTVRLWKRGQALEQAIVIFEVPEDHVRVIAHIKKDVDPPRVLFVDFPKSGALQIYLGDTTGPIKKLNAPEGGWIFPSRDFVAVRTLNKWDFSGVEYPASSLLVGKFSHLVDENGVFEVLLEEKNGCYLKKYFWAGGDLIVSVLDNLQPIIYRFSRVADKWNKEKISMPVENGVVTIWPVDADPDVGNGDLFMTAEDPLTPRSLVLIKNNKQQITLGGVRSSMPERGLCVTRHDAVSTDGTRIPYLQVGPKDNNGKAPVLMVGYGGFGISTSPTFNTAITKLWLDRGGTYILTYIRGGSEFGPDWHFAGAKNNKIQSHDDFAAIAADLVDRGVTVPKCIAAEGMSNGGLLIANMLARYPDRFGALFCANPLTDMKRFTKIGSGAAVIGEYGDPDNAIDFGFLEKISAYHNVEAARTYPPILLTTSSADDRVHPAHARKMALKLQELGHEAWFYEASSGGHSYGNNRVERATLMTLAYSFLWNIVGKTEPQQNPTPAQSV